MKMNNISSNCANCTIPFNSGNQTFNEFTVVDETNCSKTNNIAIIDAVLYIYGFSATNLASAFLDDGNDGNLSSFTEMSEISAHIIEHGVSMCGNCVAVFKEVYVAYHQLKKLGNETAILTKATKKFSPTCIKLEVDTEENLSSIGNAEYVNFVNSTRRADNAKKNADDSSEDLFDAFNFEQVDGDNGYDKGDTKTSSFSGTEPTNVLDLISSSDTISKNNDKISIDHQITVRRGRGRPRKITTDAHKKIRLSSDPLMHSSSKSHPSRKKRSVLPKTDKNSEVANSGSEIMKIEGNESQEYTKPIVTVERRQRALRFFSNWKNGLKKANRQMMPYLQNVGPVDGNSENISNHQENSDENSSNKNLDKKTSESSTSKRRRHRPRILKCICGETFSSLDDLKGHEEISHASQEPVVCDSCGQTFKMNYLLYAHKNKEHSELSQLQCNLCHQNFQSQTALKAHIDHQLCKAYPKILECHCGETFRCLRTLRNHESKHETQEPVICDICGDSFTRSYMLYAHKSSSHSELPQILINCDLCDAKFLQSSELSRHKEYRHLVNTHPLICDKCGSSFKCKILLRKHMRTVHVDDGRDKELFKCKECGKNLKHSHSLKMHMKIMHGNQKTFICHQCGKTTKNMSNMRIHMKVHDPNRILKRPPPTSTPAKL